MTKPPQHLEEIKTSAQGCLHKHSQCARYWNMACFRRVAPKPFIDQQNIRADLQSKTDRFAFSNPKFCTECFIDVLHHGDLKPLRSRGDPCPYNRRSFRVL